MDALRIAVLPEKQDPDTLIRHDADGWRALITKAIPVVEFLMEAEAGRLDLGSSRGKVEAVEKLLPMIYATPDWAEQSVYFDRLATLVGVSREELRSSVGRMPAGRKREAGGSRRKSIGTVVESVFRGAEGDVLEGYTLALLIQYPELIARSDEISTDYIERPEYRALLSAIREAGTIETEIAGLDDHLQEQLSRLSDLLLPPADRTQRDLDFSACARRLEERHLRRLKAQEEVILSEALGEEAESQDPEYFEAINRQAILTNERLRQLFISSGSSRGG